MSLITSASELEQSGVAALFGTYLRALCDPEGGSELHRMHAADAAIRHAEGTGYAADIDPSAFADFHRAISLQGEGLLPRFSDPVFLEMAVDSRVGGAVAWFEVTESREPRCLIVALGTRMVEGECKIGWCTLAERLELWSYRDGLLQSLADYPWMHKADPVEPRALLDASYFRRYRRAPVQFSSLPDASFGCQMSTACCRHDFEITLPREAQLLIDAMPWESLRPELAGTRLSVRSDGKLQLKDLNETCRFLGASGLCLIHQTLGRQPFGPCCVFPFSFARTPEGIAVGLSPVCGSTRLGSGIPLQKRADDLHERLIHAEPRTADSYRLAPAAAISWERFRDIEKALCDCLASSDLPMRRRLYVGTRLLGALQNNEPIDLNAWLSEPPLVVTPDLREAIRGMLARILTWDRAALRRLPRDLPAELHTLEVRDAAVVTRILQNTLFCKVYSYPFDLMTAHNFLIVLYLLTLIMEAAAVGPLSDVMWRELGSLGVHGALKSVLHDGVPEGFRALFGTPEFGLWMLGT